MPTFNVLSAKNPISDVEKFMFNQSINEKMESLIQQNFFVIDAFRFRLKIPKRPKTVIKMVSSS